MKIVLHTQYYPPEFGAPQARLSNLTAQMVKHGIEVTVMTAMPNYPTGKVFDGYGRLRMKEELKGVKVVRSYVYPSNKLGMLDRMISYASFAGSSLVVGGVTLGRVDFLFSESPPLFLGPSGYLLSKLKRAKWIFNVSDLWPQSIIDLGYSSNSRLLKIAFKIEAFCYKHAALVTCQSKGIEANIKARFPKVKTYLLSNGVDTVQYYPGRKSAVLRERYFPGMKFVALYAGLHGFAQGLDQILLAAEKVRDQSDIHFVFIGDGAEKPKLRSMAQEMNLGNVHFYDPAPHSEIPDILANADVSIIPLKGTIEGAVPSKIYEAMSSGVPIVLLAGGEPARIIRETNCGVVNDTAEAGETAKILANLMANPDLCSSYGKNGRLAAESKYSRERIAIDFIDYLKNWH